VFENLKEKGFENYTGVLTWQETYGIHFRVKKTNDY
jgi:hypothetical protein